MKIKVILFLVSSFSSIGLSVNKEETFSNTSLGEIKLVSKDCPLLLKIIKENNITNYTTNCRYSEVDDKKITEESVLQQACSIVQKMLLYICENRINITNNILSLDGDHKMSICPFNFTHFTQPNTLNLTSIEEILTSEKYCNRVCYDIYEPKKQCLVLYKINKYLKNLNLFQYSGDKATQVHSEVVKTEAHPTTNFLNDIKNKNEKISNKEILSKENIEGKEIKDKKYKNEEGNIQSTPVYKGEDHFENLYVSSRQKFPEESHKIKEESKINASAEIEQNFTVLTKSVTLKNEPKPSNLQNDETNMNNEDVINDSNEGEDHEELIDSDLQKSDAFYSENKILAPKETSLQQSSVQNEIYSKQGFFQAEDSHFFFYFLMCSSVIIIGYLAFHNKKKIIAFALEGRSGRRIRRRPNPAKYRKLESNLEEVIASSESHSSVSSVVY